MSYRTVSRFRRGFSRYRWSAAPDHWLLTRRQFWMAEYRRVFLKDVTSVVIYSQHRERVRALVWACLGGGLAWLLGRFGAARADWVLLALGVAGVIYELGRGEFGAAEIRTATSVFAFPLAGRWRASQRAAAQLRAAVEGAQGGTAPAGDWTLPPLQTGRAAATAEPTAPARWSGTLWAAVLLLLADGLLQLWRAASNPAHLTSPHWINTTLSLGSWVLGILAVVAAFRYRCAPGTRLFAVIYAAAYPVQLTVYVTAALMTSLQILLIHGVELIGWQQRFALKLALFNGSLEVVVGVAAIAWFLTQRRHYDTTGAAQPEPAVAAR